MTKTQTTATRRTRGARRPLVIIWIVGLGLIAAAVLYALALVGPAPPKRIVLAAGAEGGAYHAYAERYRAALAEQGIEVEVLETAGSVENLDLLHEERADVAFVQSGAAGEQPSPDQLRGIASLFYEPLWIFHRGTDVATLADMRGKRLAIGSPRSGTNTVVRRLLELNGVGPDDAELLELDMKAAAEAIEAGTVDFAFFVASPRAEVVAALMVSPNTRLVSIRRYKAYVRNVLFVKDLEIAEGTFDLRQNFPAKDIFVLSTLATLVCQKDLHPAIVELLARTARDLHSGRQLLERGGEFPSPDFLEFPIHEAAGDYFQSGPSVLARYMPFWLAQLLKRLMVAAIPLITLMIPLSKVAPALYKALMRRRIHRFYDDLDRIEEKAATADGDAEVRACVEQLDSLARDVERGIEVPTGFRGEEYELRLHVEQVRNRIGTRLADA